MVVLGIAKVATVVAMTPTITSHWYCSGGSTASRPVTMEPMSAAMALAYANGFTWYHPRSRQRLQRFRGVLRPLLL